MSDIVNVHGGGKEKAMDIVRQDRAWYDRQRREQAPEVCQTCSVLPLDGGDVVLAAAGLYSSASTCPPRSPHRPVWYM